MRELEKFVIRDQEKPGEFEGLLRSIEFFRAELGMSLLAFVLLTLWYTGR